mmetsp:Transcript_75486/g.157451  ORF Transcript_75486/g.157451 Transcript_75486/m.157451 type:complete len:172 (+) Transcript_75486:74-589(+)
MKPSFEKAAESAVQVSSPNTDIQTVCIAAFLAVALCLWVALQLPKLATRGSVEKLQHRAANPAAAELLAAAGRGDAQRCGLELQRRPDLLEACNLMGQTSLMLAAGSGHFETCNFLLEQRADVEAMDHTQRTALSHASQAKHFDICRLLLEHGADVEASDCLVREVGCQIL